MKREEFVLYRTFPSDAISDGWKAGIDISHVAYGSRSWAVLMAEQTGFTSQRYFQRDDFPSKSIDDGWKENYYITNITWGDSTWVLIMSEGCGFTDQQWRCGSKFPARDVEKAIKAGFHISFVTYGQERWVVVLSRTERTYEQKWEMSKDFPEEAIEEYWNQGYIITSLAYGDQKWLLVVSKGSEVLYQSWSFRRSFPESEISEKRSEGYWVSSLTYGNGLWVVVMSMTEEEYQKRTTQKPQETKKKPRIPKPREQTPVQSSDTSAPDEVKFELAMGELRKLTGLAKVKDEVDALMKYIKVEKLRKTRGLENDFGQEAIDTLLKRMEDERDKLIVILAGYTTLMKKVVDSNPGLPSRSTRSFIFSNYSVNEMTETSCYNCKKKGDFILKDSIEQISDYFSNFEGRTSSDFGNARFVRNLFDKTVQEL
ncbi:MAG: hypothetical protein WCO02_04340 [Bacteroidota bacterium]